MICFLKRKTFFLRNARLVYVLQACCDCNFVVYIWYRGMGQPSVGFHRPTKSSFLLHFWAHFLAGEVSPRQRNFVNFQKDFVTFSKSPKNFGKRLSFDFFVKKTLFEGQKPRFFKFWRIRCRNMEFHRPPLASEVWIRDPQYLWNGSNLKDIALLLLIKNSIRMSICSLASRDFFSLGNWLYKSHFYVLSDAEADFRG